MSESQVLRAGNALAVLLWVGGAALVGGGITWIAAAQAAAHQHQVNELASTMGPYISADSPVPAEGWMVFGIVITIMGGICLLAWMIIEAVTPDRG